MFERLCRAAVIKMTDEMGLPLEASDWTSAREVVRAVLVALTDIDDEIADAGALGVWDGEGVKPSNWNINQAIAAHEEIISAILKTDLHHNSKRG